jgi:hypothetical protein
MVRIPSDYELQRMSAADLAKLWAKQAMDPTNSDWVRVAREIRYRERHLGKYAVFTSKKG